MDQEGYTVFSFSHGGYLPICHRIKIDRVGDRYQGTLFEMFVDKPVRTFDVSDEVMAGLRERLGQLGTDNWFSRYNNFNVLDGIQWRMEHEGVEHCGANSFPPNFTELANYLADTFDCPGLAFDHEIEREYPENPNPVSHIVDYCPWMGDPSDRFEQERIASLDVQELEEERLALRKMQREMLNDLDMLVRREPALADYRGIIKKSGIGLSLQEMREADLSQVDADTIIAMMICIYRADRFCESQERFIECMKDGTFKRWLARLEELVGCSAC